MTKKWQKFVIFRHFLTFFHFFSFLKFFVQKWNFLFSKIVKKWSKMAIFCRFLVIFGHFLAIFWHFLKNVKKRQKTWKKVVFFWKKSSRLYSKKKFQKAPPYKSEKWPKNRATFTVEKSRFMFFIISFWKKLLKKCLFLTFL